jgi:CRP-like cAMP-binding protein
MITVANTILRDYFENFGTFTEEEIQEALPLFKEKTLKKSEAFISEGERCTEVGFILSGICRSFYLSGAGEEITYCFRFPGEFVTAYSSFITGQGSLENMQTLTKTELLVISKADVEMLADKFTGWLKFLKIIAEQQYIELEKRIFQLQRVHAKQRYDDLLKNHPEYVQQIPLQHIASYLGITQRHLSRIRKELVF